MITSPLYVLQVLLLLEYTQSSSISFPAVCDGSISSAQDKLNCAKPGDLLIGQHLNITIIEQEGFVNLEKDDFNNIIYEDPANGIIFTSSSINTHYSGGGFVLDMIGFIASHGQFTYTLFTPSGLDKLSSTPYDPSFSKSYGTGQLDVWNNRTQVYWSMFYITNYRQMMNRFTIPFLSGNGLTVSMSSSQAISLLQHFIKNFSVSNDSGESKFRILQTFSLDLWLTSFLLFFMCGVIYWFLEAHTESNRDRFVPRKDRNLKPLIHEFVNSSEGGFARKPISASRRNQLGLYTRDSFRETFFAYFERTFLTFTAHSGHAPTTGEGRIFNMAVCLFAVIWVSAFTANLSAILNSQKVDVGIKSIEELVLSKKVTCLPEGYSYTPWVVSAFPKLQYKIVPLGDEGSKQSLRNFESGYEKDNCEAMISCEFVMREHQNNPSTCGDGLGVVSEKPLQWGLSDLAVGVRNDLPDVERALSYWIQELRNCAPANPTSICYNRKNLHGLYEKWVDTGNCGEGNIDVNPLGVGQFAAPITLLLFCGMICMAMSIKRNWQPLSGKISAKVIGAKNFKKCGSGLTTTKASSRLFRWIQATHPDVIIEGELRPHLLVELLRANETNDTFVEPLVSELKVFFTQADVGAYQLLKASFKLLAKQKLILLENQKIGSHENEIFLNSSIYNCLDTIEMLLWRALREDKEWRRMNTMKSRLRSIKKDYKALAKPLPNNISTSVFKDFYGKPKYVARVKRGQSFNEGSGREGNGEVEVELLERRDQNLQRAKEIGRRQSLSVMQEKEVEEVEVEEENEEMMEVEDGEANTSFINLNEEGKKVQI